MNADPRPVPVWRAPRALAIALVALADPLVLALEPRSLSRAVVSQSAWVLLAGLCAASAVVRARRETRAFLGWNLLGMSFALMSVATASTVVEYLRAGSVLPFPRFGDWLQLPAFAAMGFALLAWPLGSASPSVRLRTFLDATLFAIAIFATIWATVLWSLSNAGVSSDVWAVTVGQFGTMAVLFAIIAYVAMGDTARLKGPVGWITAALAAAMFATVAILAAGASGTFYVGHWSELGAGLPLLLFIQATVTPRPVTGSSLRHDPARLDPLLFGGWLTYGSVFVACGFAFWAMMFEQRDDTVLIALGFAIITLLVLRQLLAVRDVRRLTGGLEAQVEERTRALDESQAALVRAARLEALGRLAGGVAHDFNNLLTGILGYAEMIETSSRSGDPRRADAQEIMKSVERGARLTRQLLAFARKQPGTAMVLDPLALIQDLENLLRRLIGSDIRLTVGAPAATSRRPAGRVSIDPGQLEQVIVNLVLNARDAMPAGGLLWIEVDDARVTDHEAERMPNGRGGDFVRISVRDSGSGMTPEVLARIFEPFFTTKAEGRGTGLGLPTCYGIVDQAGGFIAPFSEPGHGTRFEVYLPRTEEPEQWQPSSGGVQAPGRGTETILLAEDEDAVREVMSATLAGQGYTVLVARDGEEAVAVAERRQGSIDLLLTDMVMPGMSGMAAAERITKLRPGLRVIVVSGYIPDGTSPSVNGEPVPHVPKPVSPFELARQVRVILDQPRR